MNNKEFSKKMDEIFADRKLCREEAFNKIRNLLESQSVNSKVNPNRINQKNQKKQGEKVND